MSILLKIIKLPLKIIAMPAALSLLIYHLACTVLIGNSSFFTGLASILFLLRPAIEWIADAPDLKAYQCLGLSLQFLIASHIASWVIDKIASDLYWMMNLICR